MKGRMVQISELIKELEAVREQWGETCVYIRDMSWGAVALNRKADDDERTGDTAAVPTVFRPATGRTIPDLRGREHVCNFQREVKTA